eukprot:TRINITY_DN200_c0_g1_i11.p3 TRINITY_DN200_c0_g1~~TRINITY_DN200_c0_g1_i11.p3  ORF type:complete len:356 (+),score=62.74 TRINITY_DN200_c0_g1_i11:4786-5853(+)
MLSSCYKLGALGLIIPPTLAVPGSEIHYVKYYNYYEPRMPVATMSSDQHSQLKNTFQDLNVTVANATIVSLDPNEWTAVVSGPSEIFFNSFFGVACSICICLSGFTIYQFISTNTLQFNVATVCILIEIAGNIIRIPAVVYNPFGLRGYAADEVLLTLHLPFSLITSILMIFFWQDLLNISFSDKVPKFLSDKYFIPAVVICILILSLEVILDIIRTQVYISDIKTTTYFLAGLYTILFLILSIFYFITSYQVYKEFMGLVSAGGAKFFKMVSVRVIISSIGMFVTVIGGVLQLTVSDYPGGFYFSWFLIYLSMFIQSVSQITVFATKSRSRSSKSKSATAPATNSKNQQSDASS